jgi:hypothetical protein
VLKGRKGGKWILEIKGGVYDVKVKFRGGYCNLPL